MDPWEFEGSSYQCTVTISRINDRQPWWFPSCMKCHRASTPVGDKYKCSGGCPCATAEPKYRLTLVGTDGTATAEFTLFGRVARQIVGKPVVALIRSVSKNQHGSSGAEFDHMVPELAALVSQKFTFSLSLNQKNLTQRNVSFQVNSILTFFGKQSYIPRPSELNSSCDGGSSAIVPSADLGSEALIDSSPLKKARLQRRTIPCRKALTFTTTNDEKNELLNSTVDGNSACVGTNEDSPVDHVKASNMNAENPGTSASSAAVEQSDAKETELPQSGGKQRSAGGRKKGAS